MLGRINYLEPSTDKVIVISAAYEVYHALKIGLREVVEHAVSCKRFGETYRMSLKLIKDKFIESAGRLTNAIEPSSAACYSSRPDTDQT